MGHMDANLMCTAGIQHDSDKGVDSEALHDAVMADRLASTLSHSHAGTLLWMSTDGNVDDTTRCHHTIDQGVIFTLNSPACNLLGQAFMGRQSTRHNQQTACVLVKAVHYTGTRQCCQLRCMMEQGIQHRSLGITGPWVHH